MRKDTSLYAIKPFCTRCVAVRNEKETQEAAVGVRKRKINEVVRSVSNVSDNGKSLRTERGERILQKEIITFIIMTHADTHKESGHSYKVKHKTAQYVNTSTTPCGNN